MNEDEDFKDEKGVALVDVKEDVEINEKVSFSIFSRWNDSLLGTIKNIYLHFGLWDCHYSNLNANIVFLPYKAFKAQTISDRLNIENAIGKERCGKNTTRRKMVFRNVTWNRSVREKLLLC